MNAQAEVNWLNDQAENPSNEYRTARVLWWDGRLDNRSDLFLLLREYLRDASSNAALALAAYERWGTNGFLHLIGDWSVVIHDDVKRTTVLASDFAGVRPLYYAVKSGQVLWSSRLQSLVDTSGISELDEHYVGMFLLYGGCPNRTPYRGIYSVPAGHAVCVSCAETKISRFWSLPVRDEIRYRNHHRYEEHLRSLFREAVSVRLQTEGPVLAELSGGLDSSSVVSVASHLMRSGAVPASSLTSVSYVWRESRDEPFIHEMEAFCGIKGVHVSTHEAPLISETDVGNAQPETHQPLRRAVALLSHQLGAKVLLTGQNGDLMMGNWFDDSLQVSASLRRLRIGRACEEALQWSKILRIPVYRVLWQAFCAAIPSSLAPDNIYRVTDGSYVLKSAETSIQPALADRLGLSEPGTFFSDLWVQAASERRKYFRSLLTTLELRDLQAPELWLHVDYTHPFAHRPLVEFLMTVPVDILCGPGEPRKLMRSALSDLWPAKLRMRRSKGLFNLPWQEALGPVARTLENAREFLLVERGFLDDTSLRSRLRRCSEGFDCNESQLRNIIVFELWLRARKAMNIHERCEQKLFYRTKKGGEPNAETIRSSPSYIDRASK